jgi:hypothetical protein
MDSYYWMGLSVHSIPDQWRTFDPGIGPNKNIAFECHDCKKGFRIAKASVVPPTENQPRVTLGTAVVRQPTSTSADANVGPTLKIVGAIVLAVFGLAFLAALIKGPDKKPSTSTPAAPPVGTPRPAPAESKATLVRTYLDANFQSTSWYPHIKDISVRGRTVAVSTDLPGKGQTAFSICSGVSGFVFARLNESLDLQNVEIDGASGRIIAGRVGYSDTCR